VRIDSGVAEGDAIGVHYDPLIAKLIVHAETRDRARARAIAALRSFPVLGIRTNLAFLIAVLEHRGFAAGAADTGFIEEHLGDLVASPPPPAAAVAAAALAADGVASTGFRPPTAVEPWERLGAWGR
jgi:3-methylcrotonyl-CoA carboxylase alpha subunit